jgi:saccharopine dehydrogenase-like NADP-dependent oxidoreductase
MKSEKAIVGGAGLAPGLLPQIAYQMYSKIEGRVEDITMFCGGVSRSGITRENPLGWTQTWSVEGLINEYRLAPRSFPDNFPRVLKVLEKDFEATRTHGGAGNLGRLLSETSIGVFYKTLRYPGHFSRMTAILDNFDDQTATKIVKAITPTFNPVSEDPARKDVVYLRVSVDGRNQEGAFGGYGRFSAMQIMTALPVCAVAQTLTDPACEELNGFVPVELLPFDIFRSYIPNVAGATLKKFLEQI